MSRWVWPHKNIILTLSVHFFEKNLSPSIIIIPDDYVVGGEKSWHPIFNILLLFFVSVTMCYISNVPVRGLAAVHPVVLRGAIGLDAVLVSVITVQPDPEVSVGWAEFRD